VVLTADYIIHLNLLEFADYLDSRSRGRREERRYEMSKRQRSDRYDGAKRRCYGQKHLYLVLDDWKKGYSIHQIDDRAFDNSCSRHGSGELLLADPPVLRLEASRGVLVGAVRSKILALWQPTAANRTVAYDTETAGLAVGPPHPDALETVRFVVAAGKRLYAVHEGGVHLLDLEPEQQHQWAWTRVSSSLLRLPGCDRDGPVEIASYAVHPDGRTVFVSAHAKGTGPGMSYAGTFSLDIGGDGGDDAEWTHRGDWMLPFKGQGHYDADLDAWVGLHSPRHMCTCDVPAPLPDLDDETPAPPRPSWELVSTAAEFAADPDPRRGHSAASLVRIGSGEFCVVESSLVKGEYVQLRLTRFRFERDRHGKLHPSSRRSVSCITRKLDSLFSPRAFCII
jgi:hypothetical protein